MHQPDLLKELTLKSLPESETTPDKSDTTDKEDHSRVFNKVTFLIEEAELEETTDQESKVEDLETSVTFKMNLTETNMKKHNKESQPPLQLLDKYHKNNKNPKNPKR